MGIICQPLQLLTQGVPHNSDIFRNIIELALEKFMSYVNMMVLEHVEADKQKGDLMTKGLARLKHEPAMRMWTMPFNHFPWIVFS